MRRTAISFCLLLAALCPGRLHAQPLLEIIALKWCSRIAVSDEPEKDKEPLDLQENGGLFKGPKLYLWMKVKGGQEALNLLRQGGTLAIIQRWRYQYYGSQTDPIDVSIDGGKLDQEVLGKLQQEIDQRGYFDWRTWGTKDNLRAEEYNVDFVNAFYDPLDCGRPLGCTMQMRIR